MEESSLGNVAQAARSLYHSGVRNLNRAESMAANAAREPEGSEKRLKLESKQQAAYEEAASQFTEAISYDSDLFEAYLELGKTYRKLGRNEEALQVHAAALRKSPEDKENFQAWTETLLILNLLGNATSAYTGYVTTNPERAEILLTEMKRWLAAKQQDPGDVSPDDVQRLGEWIAQQEQSTG